MVLKDLKPEMTAQYDGAFNKISIAAEKLFSHQGRFPLVLIVPHDDLQRRQGYSVTNAGENTYSMHFPYGKTLLALQALANRPDSPVKVLPLSLNDEAKMRAETLAFKAQHPEIFRQG